MKELLAAFVAILLAICLYVALPIGLITMIYWVFSLFFGFVFWFPLVFAIFGVVLLLKWIFFNGKKDD